MKQTALCLFVLLSGPAALALAEQNVPPSGYTAIFNGRDLSGWYGDRSPHDVARAAG